MKRSTFGRARDPVKLFETKLLEYGVSTPDEIAVVEKQLYETAEEAAAFARRSPLPDPATVADHVFVNA